MMTRHRKVLFALLVSIFLSTWPVWSLTANSLLTVPSELRATTHVSMASDGTPGNGKSTRPALSADGRYVAFESEATNLVGNDSNGVKDIFVHDRQTGQTDRVSVASDGAQGNGVSEYVAISADGRYVAFESEATNLVGNDSNGVKDIFVHDRQTGQTDRVSVASGGAQGNSASIEAAISADGRYVAFTSEASNLVGNDANGREDVFIHDRQTGQTSLVSVASDGGPGNGRSFRPSISADGRYVAFASNASNLTSDDPNDDLDIFIHDRQTGQTHWASRPPQGSPGDEWFGLLINRLAISADGRYVVFLSLIGTIDGPPSGIFLHDRQTGQTSRIVSQGIEVSISADGRYAAFTTEDDDLANHQLTPQGPVLLDANIYVYQRETGRIRLVSVASDGTRADDYSFNGVLSAGGRYIAFDSDANNLANDTSNLTDIFVHDQVEGSLTTVATIPPAGGSLNASAYSTTLTFPANTFPTTTTITYTGYAPSRYPLPSDRAGTYHFFDLTGHGSLICDIS